MQSALSRAMSVMEVPAVLMSHCTGCIRCPLWLAISPQLVPASTLPRASVAKQKACILALLAVLMVSLSDDCISMPQLVPIHIRPSWSSKVALTFLQYRS